MKSKFPIIAIAGIVFFKSMANGADEDDLTFPPELLIGVATSSYQIEGAWNVSDKAESQWDRFTHTQPHKIIDSSNGDEACDSYHKFKEDVQLLKTLGVDFYRFSISWPRLLPTGYANVVSKDGIEYYNNLINEFIKYNITPLVTLYHWDHPQVFEEMGGWTNEIMVDLFGDYARVVYREFGDRVKIFATINEPDACQYAYALGYAAPGLKLGKYGEYLCNHNLIKAHARAYHIYDDEFRAQQNGKIGMVLQMTHYIPKNKDDHFSADIAFQFQFGIYAHPVYHGDYPAIVKKRVAENSKFEGLQRSRLPTFSQEWIDYIKGTADFLGLNHYTSRYVEPAPESGHTIYENDTGLIESYDEKWPTVPNSSARVVPEGFLAVLRKLKEEYNNPLIYVTENGIPDAGELEDTQRMEYIYSYMKSMLKAIKTYECNVRAYTVWSLMDNFEWSFGYSLRFGLYHVDFTSPGKTRTPKSSAVWFKNVVSARKLLPIPQKTYESSQYENSS